MGNLFIQRLQQVTQDRVLDRSEYQALQTYQQKLKADKAPDTYIGDHVINSLSLYQNRISMSFRLPDQADAIQFDFTPAYSESDLLTGTLIEDKMGNVSQKDNLSQTDDDSNRCAASAVLTAFLISGGSFSDALKSLGMSQPPVLNYENIHLAQEKIYDLSNTDHRPGLSLSTSYRHQTQSGKIVSATAEGEVVSAAKTLGLEVNAILGETLNTRYQRKSQIDDFFARNPRGSLLVSVHLNTQTGAVLPADETHAVNHAVVVYKRQGNYYLLDSGGSYNGMGNSRKTLNPAEMSALTFTSTSTIFGLTRNPKA
jgi:hypothetical protein